MREVILNRSVAADPGRVLSPPGRDVTALMRTSCFLDQALTGLLCGTAVERSAAAAGSSPYADEAGGPVCRDRQPGSGSISKDPTPRTPGPSSTISASAACAPYAL